MSIFFDFGRFIELLFEKVAALGFETSSYLVIGYLVKKFYVVSFGLFTML